MGQDFPRMVTGYDKFFYVYRNVKLYRDQYIDIYSPNGPGEVIAMFHVVDDNNLANIFNNKMNLVVDDVTVYADKIDGFFGFWQIDRFIGPVTGNATSTAVAKSGMQIRVSIPFKNYVKLRYYNNVSPSPAYMGGALFGSIGS